MTRTLYAGMARRFYTQTATIFVMYCYYCIFIGVCSDHPSHTVAVPYPLSQSQCMIFATASMSREQLIGSAEAARDLPGHLIRRSRFLEVLQSLHLLGRVDIIAGSVNNVITDCAAAVA